MREILKTAEHEKTLSSGLVTKHRSERRVVALCGAGGMGKSQLALMHAHEHVTRAYSSVIWINAHSRAILDASIAKIAKEIADHYGKETPATYQRFARVLGFPEDPRMLLQSFQESDIAWKLGILPKWLAIPENHHWLVVIDNNDRVQGNTTDRDSILPEREFLPSTGGSVIVTTRLTGRAGIHEKLKIKEMDPKSSLELLLKSAGMERETLEPHGMWHPILQDGQCIYITGESVIAEAEKLVEDLGGLPIALDQAGAYIQQRDVDFTEYRDRLQRYFKEVAQASSDGASERLYDQPAFYWTWDISYRDLKEQHPNAAELLVLCAFLHNVEIHQELLRRGKIFGKPQPLIPSLNVVDRMCTDEMILNEAVDTLASYSLITRSMGTTGQPGSRMKSFSMHALAHKWARIQLSPEDQKQYTKKAMGIISSATSLHEKKRNDSDWFFGQMIEPHIHACRGYLESYLKDDILDVDSALAAHNIGIAFDDLSLFQLAELPYRKALQGLENADRQEKNLTAVRHSLGKNLSYQSRYAEAHEYLKSVIEYHELHGEKTSIDYLDTLHSIGAVYRYQGKLEDALQNYKAAHDGFLQHHPENQGLLLAKLEIGYVHQLMHNPEASLKWLQPALVGFEREFGPLHPWTLNTVHFIANVYRRQKKYDDALAWYHRALAGKEEKLGKDHLSTLGTVAAIAETDIVMGRCEEGLAGYRRALEGRKKATGENSMWTLSAVHGVGFALQGMGDYTGALEYYRRALDGRRKVMGDDHQQTLESVHSLVEVYQLLGQEHEAERLCGEYKIGYKKGV
jgi:tetratricopeptide (TPR) repeat protein